ncbi:hypothetical protein ABIB62_001538 [Mucilaginibacter sp. UYP25]|uniref:hypothetical protein n=1 Tax=unclassified Mucilaginibacter TaxID=2617802 RepID=UPI00339498B2
MSVLYFQTPNHYFTTPLHKEMLFVDHMKSVKEFLKYNPNSRLMVYVLNADTCMKYQTKPQILESKVLKLFILSEKDIMKDSTVIVFSN